MRSAIFVLSFLVGAAAAAAQSLPAALVHAGYNWDPQRRQRLPISAADAELPAVVLRDFTSLEYYFDERAKAMHLYATEHRIVRVNTSDGIERYNKIVVPVLETGAPVDVKARTISPRGEVKEVRTADMKELKDENGQRGFRVFAVDGVEKGSEVEYFYTREKPFNHFGGEVMQTETPARDVTFEVISPRRLTFEARTYNGPAPVADTTLPGRRVLRLHLKEVAALRPEAFANLSAKRLRVEYKLAYMANTGEVRQFTWADASKNLFQTMTTLGKDDQKAVDKVLAAAKIPATAPVAERIAAAEKYVKLNFNLEPGGRPSIAQMVATRNGTEASFTYLLANMYRKMGIGVELVVTCSRDKPLDGAFDSWTYLDNFLLYFPETQQYLAPGRADFFYGMVPAEWTDTPGLFVKTVKLGSIESAVGSVKTVPALAAEKTKQDLDIRVAFAPDLSNSTVTLSQTLGGYYASTIQPYWSMIPEPKRKEVLLEMQKGVVPDATNVRKLEVLNVERGTNPLAKPFIVNSEFDSASLLDKAGPRYLFKIGTLLGPQTELYQKEERQFDVENDNNRSYLRTIRFEVPAGYTVRNLNDLNANVKAGPDAAKPSFDFVSSYKQEGSTVTVTITENYRQLHWPKGEFEAFRAVVNAAANFNKVVLVLDKKS